MKGQIPVSTAVEIAPPENAAVAPFTDVQKGADKNAETLKKNEAPVKEQKKTDLSSTQNATAEQNQSIQKEKNTTQVPITNSGAVVPAKQIPEAVRQTDNTSGGNTQPVAGLAESAQLKSGGGTSIPETNPPIVGNNAAANTPAVTETEKKSLGVYKVASKANFYTAPNENSLSGQFIYQFSPVTLDAIDETKDFILVVTKNNLGTDTKGWLSKKDLRRIDQ